MKKALIIIIGSVSFLIAVLLFGFYAFFAYSVKTINNSVETMHKKQIVAENVQITSEWLEIKAETPLKITKRVQNIELLIEGYEHDINKNDFGNIQLKDGTFVNPEVQIVDENGKTYQLKYSQRSGDLIGFSLNEKIHGTHSFPKEVTYKSIRIRSDNPFLCKKIIWHDYDVK